MKLLLDESVPKRLAGSFPEAFTVRTVQEMGWAGIGNSCLLALAAHEGFQAMISVDRGIEHQQNLDALPVPVVIMFAVRNRLTELQPLVPAAVDSARQKTPRFWATGVILTRFEPRSAASSGQIPGVFVGH